MGPMCFCEAEMGAPSNWLLPNANPAALRDQGLQSTDVVSLAQREHWEQPRSWGNPPLPQQGGGHRRP